MTKAGIFALMLSFLLLFSACGSPSDNSADDESGITAPNDSSQAENTSGPGSNATDDFLKTITAETAEAKGVCGADLTWYYQEGVLVIKGSGKMNDYDLEYNTPPWWMGADLGEIQNSKISWVILDDGVASIGSYAFAELPQLSKVVMPETLTEIRDYAFSGCENLTSITFPKSLAVMGEYILERDFTYVETITFLGDAPENLFGGLYGLHVDTVYYSGSGFDEMAENSSNGNWVKQ